MVAPPPVVTARVPVPAPTETTVVSVVPVSASVTDRALLLPVENTSGVSSFVFCGIRMGLPGASLMEVAVTTVVASVEPSRRVLSCGVRENVVTTVAPGAT